MVIIPPLPPAGDSPIPADQALLSDVAPSHGSVIESDSAPSHLGINYGLSQHPLKNYQISRPDIFQAAKTLLARTPTCERLEAQKESPNRSSISSNVTNPQTTPKIPPLPPQVGVRLKRTTTEVVRASVEQSGGGRRGECKEISKAAIKNAVEVLTNTQAEFNSLIVCTYPANFPTDGRIVKAHHKALIQALDYRHGEFEYFTAIEYQKRGAPHFHMAASSNLADYGEVIRLKRLKNGRRKPTFQTVKPEQDWLFETWVDIIRKPNPSYDGQLLDWPGLSADNEAAMREAYYTCNAGVAWEVMREKGKAANYLVKELRGLKEYQKLVPDGFMHPGRHFLYSRGVPFPEKDVIEFACTESLLREVLAAIGWQYTPEGNKPLFKRLWNTAGEVASKLIELGYRPINGGLEMLRRFADMRLLAFVHGDDMDWACWNAETQRGLDIAKFWQDQKRRIARAMEWEFILSQEPARAGP